MQSQEKQHYMYDADSCAETFWRESICKTAKTYISLILRINSFKLKLKSSASWTNSADHDQTAPVAAVMLVSIEFGPVITQVNNACKYMQQTTSVDICEVSMYSSILLKLAVQL